MKVIFCLSNLFIPSSIMLINEYKEEDILIYTYESGIKKFFEELKLERVKVYFRDEVNYKKFRQFFKLKFRTFKYFNTNKNIDKIYFFHNTFGLFENWLIKKLSKDIKIVYIPTFDNLGFKKRLSLKGLKQKIISLFFYGLDSEILWTGDVFLPRTKPYFFKTINAQYRRLNIDPAVIDSFTTKHFQLPDGNIVLLTGSVVEMGRVTLDEYSYKINELLRELGVNNVLAKPHPRFMDRFALEKQLQIIPSWIPGNILLLKYKVFIGYSTCVVSEAVSVGRLGISLLDFFKPNSITMQNNYKNYLNTNLTQGEIKYPKTTQEIKDLISEIK
mgnify:CR=1 FL=1|tara:strand:- start:9359 stop:10348 length:990 start_codon:yes stop_codon:yes gene_type:complete